MVTFMKIVLTDNYASETTSLNDFLLLPNSFLYLSFLNLKGLPEMN